MKQWNYKMKRLCSETLKGIGKRAELNKCDVCLVSRILWHLQLLLWKNGDYDSAYSPVTFCYYFSLQAYAAPFQWRLLIFVRKNLWCWVLEAKKKHVSLKSYSLKMRIVCKINMLTRITDWKILWEYSCSSNNIKNWGPSPYNSLHHTHNRKCFSVL